MYGFGTFVKNPMAIAVCLNLGPLFYLTNV